MVSVRCLSFAAGTPGTYFYWASDGRQMLLEHMGADAMLSGAIIVFSLSASAFATPAIIGGRRLKVAATLAYDEFLNTLNWPLGAAVATLLLAALVLIVVGSNALIERRYAEVFR